MVVRRWAVFVGGLFVGAGCMTQPADRAADRAANLTEPAATGATGALCAFALAAAQAEFGRRCRAGRNPALQAGLESVVSRLEAHIATDPRFGPAQIAAFKRDQAWVGRDRAELCANEDFQNYDRLTEADIRRFQRETDAIIARGGPVEQGDCL